ncbi:PT domain-containing protein [Dactylosporangium roseum]|uniref:PT domain-containing protein n=1 Tax=Dactylosporangium roseum TaxID=47989 RepID=A0ABY5Z6Z2_9ACTN|nr:PT domain-containing protein [Dactylosporangium roseum]UWZ37820.1 PT domain-containing protein [Dactylosporangium roseum]
MTASLTESPWAAGPPPVAQANGHRPIIDLPSWTSRDAVDEPTDVVPVEPTADRPTVEAPATQSVTEADSQAVDRPTGAGTVKAVAPLVVVNALAVYGQLAYALEHIAPTGWILPARAALSVGFAAAVESVALYVGWHAHDALLIKAHATARRLRRWSFLIAAAVAAMNYAHFAHPGLRPTAAACAFGLLSLLSPWMWGLHTRRQQHLQLVKERRVDEAGAEFSAERRRNFPIRAWQARRWSIDHGVTDPREAWDGYNAERRRKADEKCDRRADRPTGRPDQAPTATRPADRGADRRPSPRPTVAPTAGPDRESTDRPAAGATDRPTGKPTAVPTVDPTGPPTAKATDRAPARRRPTVKAVGRHSSAAVANAAILRERYGDRLAQSEYAMRQALGWSHGRMVAAVAAHKAKADLPTDTPTGGGGK